MTIPENGAIAAGDVADGALGLTNGISINYREIDSGQRKAIHALGRRFADLAGGHPCLLLFGKIIGLGDVG